MIIVEPAEHLCCYSNGHAWFLSLKSECPTMWEVSRSEGPGGGEIREAPRTLGLYAQEEERDLKTSSMYNMDSMKVWKSCPGSLTCCLVSGRERGGLKMCGQVRIWSQDKSWLSIFV